MTEAQLFDRIRQRYPSPAWAVLRHVRNQTGYSKSRVRTADAMALSLYPSNGLAMHGFEIKVSKSDLKKEIFDPTKSAEFSEYCDYWWLVLSSEDLMAGLQCPESWGVLVPDGKSLKVHIKAPKLSPKAMDMGIICGLLRKASEASDDVLKGMVPREDMLRIADERVQQTIDTVKRPLENRIGELQKVIADFEKETGLKIGDSWYSREVIAAIKHVREHGKGSVLEKARRELADSRRYTDVLADVVEKMSAVGNS